ncbi:MAG: cation transporter, partial [Thermoplasmata archaeon]
MEDIFQKGQKITIRVVLVVIAFSVAKGLAGFFSGSVVLLADAVHSAADSFSTFLVWLGLKIAQKKPTERFQYGYYKAENLSTLLVSVLIFYAGFEIVRESLAKIFVSYQLHIPLVAVSVAVLDAIVMFLLGTYEVKIGRKINAQSLVADGSES